MIVASDSRPPRLSDEQIAEVEAALATGPKASGWAGTGNAQPDAPSSATTRPSSSRGAWIYFQDESGFSLLPAVSAI